MPSTHTIKPSLQLFAFAMLLHFSTITNAQVEPNFLASVEESSTVVEKTVAPEKTAYFFRHFKKLSPTYQGYLIQLTLVDAPLRRDYPLFQFFGNVYYQRLKDGKIGYYILGNNFGTRGGVKKFIKEVVKAQAPEAKLVVKKKI